jgi:methylase of polypeptide subunit release factors
VHARIRTHVSLGKRTPCLHTLYRHESLAALDGGDDGLSVINAIYGRCAEWLNPTHGWAIVLLSHCRAVLVIVGSPQSFDLTTFSTIWMEVDHTHPPAIERYVDHACEWSGCFDSKVQRSHLRLALFPPACASISPATLQSTQR